MTTDADKLAARVAAELPPAATWTMPPRGYRSGLALCVIDGVARQAAGADQTADLLAAFRAAVPDDAEQAGLAALAEVWGHDASRTVTLAQRAGALLIDHGIHTTADLVERLKAEGLHAELGTAWVATEGLTQRMWTDTAMLAGYLDPDVDRVISAYVSRAMGSDPATSPADRVIAALTEVAARFESSILPLEFAILEYERA